MPSVRTTGWPGIGVPLEVSVEVRVAVDPGNAWVGPEYVTVVGALLITSVLCPPLGRRVVVVVPPPKDPVTG